jgi:hypothetical protein
MDEWLSFQISSLVEIAEELNTAIAFPFTADDVQTIYTLKFGDDEAGDGLWFRLKDGRMFNGLGQPDKSPRSCFEQPYDASETGYVAAVVLDALQSGRDGQKTLLIQNA